ncbi:hypothetical protein F5146DRAFT_1004324 [Armillaria mellea]|nr:hypothetical protein F5146DRAFT_1004324 [Armillaria mellea]
MAPRKAHGQAAGPTQGGTKGGPPGVGSADAQSRLRGGFADQGALQTSVSIASHVEVVGVKRPSYGKERHLIKILSNVCEASVPEGMIYQYDVQIYVRRRWYLFDKMQNSFRDVFTPHTVYDGETVAFASHDLDLGISDKRQFDLMMDNGPEQPPKRFIICLTKSNVLNLEVLQRFTKGLQSYDNEAQKALTALHVTIQMTPSLKCHSRSRSFYMHETKSIGSGLLVRQGYFQSVRPTVDRNLIDVDIITGIMYKYGPLIPLCLESFSLHPSQAHQLESIMHVWSVVKQSSTMIFQSQQSLMLGLLVQLSMAILWNITGVNKGQTSIPSSNQQNAMYWMAEWDDEKAGFSLLIPRIRLLDKRSRFAFMTDTSPWTPRCTVEEADKILTAPGSPLEIETRVVNETVLKVWKNLWPSIRAFFLHSSKEHAHKTCVVYEKERYTFQEMLDIAVKCAAIFRDVYGIKKGDRVVICSRNFPSYYVVFWGCHLLGAVTALVNAWLPSELLRHCITLTKCSLIILDPERAERIEPIATDLKRASGASGYLVLEDHEGKGHWEGMDVWSKVFPNYVKDPGEILRDDPHIVPEDNATIIFTSGTTGLPKGVLSTHRGFLTYLFNSASVIGRDHIRRGVPIPSLPVPGTQDGILLSAPLFHATGCCTSIVQGRERYLSGRAAQLSGFPIEMITLGGAPVAPSLLRKSNECLSTCINVHSHSPVPIPIMINILNSGQAYGLTETNATCVGFYGPDYATNPGSCGFVTPVNEILIMKDDVRAATGVVGEIWLRGPNMMKGYYGDQAATDKVLTKDGWVMTGDLGYVDAGGYVYIKDRIKDIIIRGGENVDSVSVENALYTEHGVLEAAAVGVPDQRLGELVTALVTLKPGYRERINEKKLLATARKLLPKFAVPVMIILKDEEFERTRSGKIIKAQLRIIAREEWVRRTRDGSKARMRHCVIEETEYLVEFTIGPATTPLKSHLLTKR